MNKGKPLKLGRVIPYLYVLDIKNRHFIPKRQGIISSFNGNNIDCSVDNT